MVQSFQASRQNSRVGISLLVFFSCFAVLSGVGTFLDNTSDLPIRQRVTDSVVMAALWLPFIGLAWWLMLRQRRFRLLVGRKSITIGGVFRMRRVSLQDITRAKWLPHRLLRVWTSHGRTSFPVSEVMTHKQERLLRLLHDRIDHDVQIGWEKIFWKSLQRNADPQYHRTQFLRIVRISILGPILGGIAGIGLHFVWGYHPEIGLAGNFILTGTLSGCAASIIIILLMAWAWWAARSD